MVLFSGIPPYLCLPTLLRRVHLGIEAFRGRIIVKATLRGEKEMLGCAGCHINHLMLVMMSRLEFLIGHWSFSVHFISSRVCSSHSPIV